MPTSSRKRISWSAEPRHAQRTKPVTLSDIRTMKQEMRNLIRELKANGMTLDESKIFVS